MEVVCKAVCGLGEASAPKFRHDVSPFFLQRALPSALLPRGSSPWNPSCKQKYFCLRFDFSDFFCNIRNTPIKSDRSIFLSFVFLIIYLIFLPSLRKTIYMVLQNGVPRESLPWQVQDSVLQKGFYLFLLFSIIIARTFMDRPNRLMNPSASLWL